MFAVEMRDATGQVLVSLHIMATSQISDDVANAQVDLVRQANTTAGPRYYFLVTIDEVRGWDLRDGRPVFRTPTERLFAAYAGGDVDKVRGAGPEYLAGLTQAWLADSTCHWQSGDAPAPGEHDMRASGVLNLVRLAATSVTEIA